MKEAIRERIAVLEGYAVVLDRLEDAMHWYQSYDNETETWTDDEYDSAKYALIAIRETMKAVKKLAGI